MRDDVVFFTKKLFEWDHLLDIFLDIHENGTLFLSRIMEKF